MKHLILTFLFSGSLFAHAQQPLSYTGLLDLTKEVDFSDSLQFNHESEQVVTLDTNTVKEWFGPVLSVSANNKFKNRVFSLAGKITSQENFDLHILLEEKTKSDSSSTQVVYLVSTKKNGEYIASLKAAFIGEKKKTAYNITSCLYKDFKIRLASRITVANKAFDDMALYKINAGGRFVSYPRNY